MQKSYLRQRVLVGSAFASKLNITSESGSISFPACILWISSALSYRRKLFPLFCFLFSLVFCRLCDPKQLFHIGKDRGACRYARGAKICRRTQFDVQKVTTWRRLLEGLSITDDKIAYFSLLFELSVKIHQV